MSLRAQAAPTATASYGKLYVDSGDSNKLKYMNPAGAITDLTVSGALTHFTESVNTAAPNATTPVVRLLATNAATNVDIALSPKGSGGISAHLADNATAGGDKRGQMSIDLQIGRSSSTEVASGSSSVLIGGYANKATAVNSMVGAGNFNTAAGAGSFIAAGTGNTASGNTSFAMGNSSNSQSYAQFTVGQYNALTGGNATAWMASDPVFVVGIGTSGARANAMTVLKNGNVGIGTTSPSGKLNIEGGDVFIGTGTLTNGTVGDDLSVSGNIEADGNIYANQFHGDGSNLTGVTVGPAGANTQIQFNNSGSLGASSNLVWNNSMLRLGIGTSSPSVAIHANYPAGSPSIVSEGGSASGSGTISAASDSASVSLQAFGSTYPGSLSDGTTLADSALLGTNLLGPKIPNKLILNTQTAIPMHFGTDSRLRMTISSSGNVGIGTTAPDTKLHVVGTSGNTLKIVDGNQGLNKVLTSDANGVASWQTVNATPSFPLLGPNGSWSGPTYSFTSSPTTGMYASAANELALAAGGVRIVQVTNTKMTVSNKAVLSHGNTASTPTYTYEGNENTGLFFPAASTMAVSTGGNERLRVDSSGNVGIGTTDPQAKLDVAGGAVVSRTNIINSGATVNLALGNNHLLKSVGSPSITLQNPLDGGAYTLVISDTTSRTYTFSGCTNSYFNPANAATTAGTRSTYTILVIKDGSDLECYISWMSGFQ